MSRSPAGPDAGVWSPRRRDRGAALPLSIFGLVLLSVLVTSALLTAATEFALSRAHQEAVRGLHAASGALEQFVAELAARTETDPDLLAADGTLQATAGGSAFELTLARLFEGPAMTLPDGAIEQRDIYSVIAAPSGGWGRSVGAFFETVRTIDPVTSTASTHLGGTFAWFEVVR